MSAKAVKKQKVTKAVAAKKSAAKKSATKSAAKSAAPKNSATKRAAVVEQLDPAVVAHRIHALLHTMHAIERYEERLCSMQDAIKRTGRLGAPLQRDLQALLEEIPAEEYLRDLHAVRESLAGDRA